MTKRILLAGLFHETHTFLDGLTPLDDFRVRRGDELLSARGDASPLSGVLEVAEQCGWELLPTIDMRATPSATVSDDVFAFWWDEFRRLATPQLNPSVDGIILVLHGAMACETIRDVEGELLWRIRDLPELADVPLCGVYDLHGNISAETAAFSQGMIAYRNNPHTDSHAAAVRAAELLDRILTTGDRPVCVWDQPAVMWPPTGTGTDDDPMRTLGKMARAIEDEHEEIVAVNVFGGFSFADTPSTGVSFSAVTFGERESAQSELRKLSEWATNNRELGNLVDPPLASVIPAIREQVAQGVGPIVIVEPADNIGGGAPGDATTVLRTMIEAGISGGAVAINDPAAVQLCQQHSIGDRISISLGGKGSRLTDGPITLDVELISTSDGAFDLEDRNSHLASMNGLHINMGPCAVVRNTLPSGGDVRILITTRRTPPFDLGQWRSQGIEPESLTVIGVKAAVAHRRAYDKIAAGSYTVSIPGPCTSDLATFPWQHVRRPVFPLDDLSK